MQFDPVTSEGSPLTPVREGLPKAFRMRHGRHYVEQLMGDAPLRTVREIAVADFHAVPDSEADLSTLQQSIGSVGVLQPLLVTLDAGRYRVIAGRNRLRAAMAVGLQAVPCLVHDVPGDGLESLRQAAGRRAVAPRVAEIRAKETVPLEVVPVDVRSAISVAESSALSPSMIAAAVDDRLRLAVLADLMGVELQRAETLARAAAVLDSHTPAAREQVTVGALVNRLLARIRPEARLRNVVLDVTRFRCELPDSRGPATAGDRVRVHGARHVAAVHRRDVEVAHRSRGRARAAGIDCGGLAEHRLDRRARIQAILRSGFR